MTILLSVACEQAPPLPSELVVVRDSLGITIVENNYEAMDAECSVDAAPVLTIGQADGEEPYLLYRVSDATRLADGRIAIANQGSHEVRIYDSAGQFTNSFGRKGEGPAEFHDRFQLWSLPGDTLWIADYRPLWFEIFDPEGRFVRGFAPEPASLFSPSQLDLLDDGRSVLATRREDVLDPDFTPTEMPFVIHGIEGAALDTVGYFPSGYLGRVVNDQKSLWTYPLFESFSQLATRGTHIAIGTGSKPEVLIFDADDSLHLRILLRWTAKARRVTDEHVSAEKERIRAQYELVDERVRDQLIALEISPDRPIRETFPSYDAQMYGTDGRLWIREYPIPGENAGQKWNAFDENGFFHCFTTLPESIEVDEIGPDYLLGMVKDDSGIERILMYALNSPSREL